MKCFAGSGAEEESAGHVAKQEKYIMSEIIRVVKQVSHFYIWIQCSHKLKEWIVEHLIKINCQLIFLKLVH